MSILGGLSENGIAVNQTEHKSPKKIKETTINIKSPKLHKWQKDFFKSFDYDFKDNRNTEYFIIKSPRQCGKSFTLEMLLMRQSINWKNSISWVISPVLHQARKMYKDIVKLLQNVPVIDHINNQLLEIYFKNGSEIHFGSAEQGESLRGNTVKGRGVLVIDEGAFIDDDIYGIVFPFCNVSRRPIIIASTPLFKQGKFYELFTSKRTVIHKFEVNNYNLSMFISDEQKEIYKETMPPQKYISEVLGEFMAEKSSVFGDFADVVNNDYDVYDEEFFVGIDWGTGSNQDSTAISVLNSKKQQVFLKIFNDLDVNDTIKEVTDVINKFQPKRILVEQNSIGKVFLDLLRKKVNYPITPFNTNNESKNKIINNLQVAINNKQIQLLNDTNQKVQLVAYQVESTKTGKVTYNAKSGQHDDIVIALALSLEAVQLKTYTIL